MLLILEKWQKYHAETWMQETDLKLLWKANIEDVSHCVANCGDTVTSLGRIKHGEQS